MYGSLCRNKNNVCTIMMNRTVYALTEGLFWCLFPLIASQLTPIWHSCECINSLPLKYIHTYIHQPPYINVMTYRNCRVFMVLDIDYWIHSWWQHFAALPQVLKNLYNSGLFQDHGKPLNFIKISWNLLNWKKKSQKNHWILDQPLMKQIIEFSNRHNIDQHFGSAKPIEWDTDSTLI